MFAKLHFEKLSADQCVYIRQEKLHLWMVRVYVNNMVICFTPEDILQLKGELLTKFQITDLGLISQIVGIKVSRDEQQHTLKLMQVIEHFSMSESYSVAMLLDPNMKLVKSVREDLDLQLQHSINQALVA